MFDSDDTTSCLPIELERYIFEISSYSRNDSGHLFNLLLVARYVHDWWEIMHKISSYLLLEVLRVRLSQDKAYFISNIFAVAENEGSGHWAIPRIGDRENREVREEFTVQRRDFPLPSHISSLSISQHRKFGNMDEPHRSGALPGLFWIPALTITASVCFCGQPH